MCEDNYFTMNVKDMLNTKLDSYSLSIYLDDDQIDSYFSKFDSIILIKDKKEYSFKPSEFLKAMNELVEESKEHYIPPNMKCGITYCLRRYVDSHWPSYYDPETDSRIFESETARELMKIADKIDNHYVRNVEALCGVDEK